jgi:hypothetical protein
VETVANLVDEVIDQGVAAGEAIGVDKRMGREGTNPSSKRPTTVISKTEFMGSFLNLRSIKIIMLSRPSHRRRTS